MNRIVVIMLVIAMILGLSSCRLEDSYKEFFIKGISDNKNKEYFTSEEFDFARLEDVVIVPTIKEINHGKYQVFVSAYSEKGDEIVKINKVTIKSSDSDSVNYDLDGGIIF